ncbi:protein lin-10-like [Tropilaelaps mercedesae]|uniref:Protein lin-10-like n=1 Tax=Tropilaelaps mercedesae TaxID=418985 RepID=A0A1V9X6X7_9ACAR|nr:protein lin-10-like [Tropilaelaps mercedesae]
MAPPSPTPSAPMHAGGLNGIQEEVSECSELPAHAGDRLGITRDLSPPGGVRVVSDLLGPSPPPPPPTLLNGHSAMNGGSSMKSLDELSCSNSCDTSTSQGDEGVARVIGNVPIAQYEGSPRRYGRIKRSSGLPGYPQRVYAPAKEKTKDRADRDRDRNRERLERQPDDSGLTNDDKEVKKENEAVQLLSELLNGSARTDKASPTDFSDLDYRLSYRPVTDRENRERDRQTQLQQQPQQQQQHQSAGRGDSNKIDRGGNSYVAQRLASPAKETRGGELSCQSNQASPGGSSCAPSVPPKLNLNNGTTPEEAQYATVRKSGLKDHQGPTHGHADAKEMVMLHERVQQHSLQVDMVGELDDFLGMDTSMRNLTVSPSVSNTDDCDIVDSDGTEGDPDELLSMANSGGSRLMPVLEDGLSSGHVSENDDEDTGTAVGLLRDGRKVRSTRSRSMRTAASCRVQKGSRANNRAQRRVRTHSEMPPSAPLLLGGVVGGGGGHIGGQASVSDAIREIKQAIQHSKAQQEQQQVKKSAGDSGCVSPTDKSQRELREIRDRQMANSSQQLQQTGSQQSGSNKQPVWVPRMNSGLTHTGNNSTGTNDSTQQEDDCDTDQETDRLLGEQRSEDNGFYDEKSQSSTGNPNSNSKQRKTNIDNNNHRTTTTSAPAVANNGNGGAGSNHSSTNSTSNSTSACNSSNSNQSSANSSNTTSKEVIIHDPSVLIEGVLFRARYLGSTQLVCEGQPTKATRMMQAEEAVARIKAPEGESQPSTEVDLFISTEKIMVLNTDLKEIMMDHTLRTISYIADIGDLVVLMARRRPEKLIENGGGVVDLAGTSPPPHCSSQQGEMKKKPKMICHVFESDEAQFIAQSIGQAFQVAYMEFLKANGIEDSSFIKEMDYQEVLNSQEIFGNELEMFAKKDRQKEVVVPKQKGEILGMVIVESGWGSMLPTVVIANMAGNGPAARCGMLNIGDQIIAINGVSLVGLPLSTCQTYIKNTKQQTVVKLTVVPCAPVVEVKIKRPDTKYQLGFSVQNGVICSLLRGGIAERGGVRVGHRIIEINGQSVVAVPHEKIVNLLATSVGEIHMKTMPTSMFRLLTGQESPVYI